jgi:hypothetical protein
MEKDNLNDEKIYMDYVNFSGCNESLKGQGLTCIISGKKFSRGDCFEFHLGYDPDNARFVCREEAEKHGYVMGFKTMADLQQIFDRFYELDDRAERKQSLHHYQDFELIEELLECRSRAENGQAIIHSDPDLLYELGRRGYINKDKIEFFLRDDEYPVSREVLLKDLPF